MTAPTPTAAPADGVDLLLGTVPTKPLGELRRDVRDCIGETIPLRRRWVSAVMERVVGPLHAELARREADHAAALAAVMAERDRLRADKALLLKVIDAGKAEAAFAYADEVDGSATATTRQVRLENIRRALDGVGDIATRKALGLVVETVDADPDRAALTPEGAGHDDV